MNTTINQYYTFSTEGLNDTQILFLSECERLYFEGAEVSLQFLKDAVNNTGLKGEDIAEAWDYWKHQNFAADRNSLKDPIDINSILPQRKDKGNDFDVYWINDKRGESVSFHSTINAEYFNGLNISLIYDLSPKHYYFDITNDGRLFLKYQHIIGSRFICQTK